MKIWILNHYATSPDSIGISRHYDLSKYLTRNGHEVTIFASSFNHQTRKEEHILEEKLKYKTQNYNGVDFQWIKTRAYNKNDFNRVLNILDYSYKLFKNIRTTNKSERPDVIIGSLMHPMAPLIGLYYAKKWNKRFFFEERDLWPQSLIDLGKVREKSIVVKALGRVESLLYNKSDRLILLFDKAHLYANSKNVSDDKIIYLPNGVDLERIEQNKKVVIPNSLQKFFNEKKDKIIGVYTGAHSLANDLDSLIDAIKNVEDERYEFLFLGDGPEKDNLMRRAKKEKIDNLHFHNAISKNQLHAVLTKCHFGIIKFKDLPVYRWGVSPNKIYDYMGSSLPIIIGLNDQNHIIETSNSGVVIPTNFETTFNEVLKNLSSEDFSRMGKNSYNLALSDFSWEVLSRRLEEHLL